MDTTETARFEPAIPGRDDGGRCRSGNVSSGVTSVVRPPRGPMGKVARATNIGDTADGWNHGE